MACYENKAKLCLIFFFQLVKYSVYFKRFLSQNIKLNNPIMSRNDKSTYSHKNTVSWKLSLPTITENRNVTEKTLSPLRFLKCNTMVDIRDDR